MKLKFLGGCMMFCTSIFSSAANATIVPSAVPMLTYAEHTVTTYNEPNGKKVGFISPNVSLVWIKEIRGDGWAWGSYPLASGKRVYRWFKMHELQGYSNFENYTTSFDGAKTVYRTTSTTSQKLGSILDNQEVMVVGALGNQVKIIYKVGGGTEYKMGWIDIPAPVEDTDDYYDDDTTSGGDSSGVSGIIVKGPVYQVYGDVHTDGGSISADYNDSSFTDNSYNDSSKHVTKTYTDYSYNDSSQKTTITKTDNSGSVITNIQDSFNRGKDSAKKSVGDVNNNGKVDISDAVDLLRYLEQETDSINKTAADVNNDGTLNNEDVRQLIIALYKKGLAVGDLNGDAKLTDSDLEMMRAWISGNSTGDAKKYDLNGDGRVNSVDAKILENLLRYLKARGIEF